MVTDQRYTLKHWQSFYSGKGGKKKLKTRDSLIFKNFKNLKLEVITKSKDCLMLIATVLHIASLAQFAIAASLRVFKASFH